jgi:hypothetical protein
MNKKVLLLIIFITIVIFTGIFYSVTNKDNEPVKTVINPLIPLLIGYLGSIFTIVWREESQYKREGRHRAEERQLIKEDRQTSFQRETLLSLQDELSTLHRITW